MMFQPGLGGERVYDTGKVLSLYGPAYIASVADADKQLADALFDATFNADKGALQQAIDKAVSKADELFEAGEKKRAAPLYGYISSAYVSLGGPEGAEGAAVFKGMEAVCYLRLAEALLAAAQPSSAKAYADEAVDLYASTLDLAVQAGWTVDRTAKALARQAEAKAISVAVSKGKEIVSPQGGKTGDGNGDKKTGDGNGDKKTEDGNGDKKSGDGNGDKKSSGAALALGVGVALWLLLRR